MDQIPAFYCNTSKKNQTSLDIKQISKHNKFHWDNSSHIPKKLLNKIDNLPSSILFITGAPGSGKSSFCRNLLSEKKEARKSFIHKTEICCQNEILFLKEIDTPFDTNNSLGKNNSSVKNNFSYNFLEPNSFREEAALELQRLVKEFFKDDLE